MNLVTNGRPSAIRAEVVPETSAMRRLYSIVRSTFRWILSGAYFFVVCPFLILLGIIINPRRNDRPQRMLCRHVMRLAGARIEVRRAPGFDPKRTSFFIVNHVNLFDPFVLYTAIPQFVRGWELESHFKIPAYGWMMKRFGNVPVPDVIKASDLKRLWKLTRAALEGGVSLVVFPEGGRTRDGRVGPFKDGVFRIAQQLGYPVVPVSIVGAFEFNRKDSWLLRPGKIVVHLHNTIETKGMHKNDVEALRDRVHRTVSQPVDEHIQRDSSRSSS